MGAAFKYHGQIVWGTNGSIEHYLDRMLTLSTTEHGAEHPMTRWLSDCRLSFFTGAVVNLDAVLDDLGCQPQFVALLQNVSSEGLDGPLFSDIGKKWIRERIQPFIQRLRSP